MSFEMDHIISIVQKAPLQDGAVHVRWTVFPVLPRVTAIASISQGDRAAAFLLYKWDVTPLVCTLAASGHQRRWLLCPVI